MADVLPAKNNQQQLPTRDHEQKHTHEKDEQVDGVQTLMREIRHLLTLFRDSGLIFDRGGSNLRHHRVDPVRSRCHPGHDVRGCFRPRRLDRRAQLLHIPLGRPNALINGSQLIGEDRDLDKPKTIEHLQCAVD